MAKFVKMGSMVFEHYMGCSVVCDVENNCYWGM